MNWLLILYLAMPLEDNMKRHIYLMPDSSSCHKGATEARSHYVSALCVPENAQVTDLPDRGGMECSRFDLNDDGRVNSRDWNAFVTRYRECKHEE